MNKLSVINTLAETYRIQLTQSRIELYLQALDEISPEELYDAAIEYVKVGKWMPTVVELRQAVERIQARRSLEGRKMYWWAMSNYFRDNKALEWASRNCTSNVEKGF